MTDQQSSPNDEDDNNGIELELPPAPAPDPHRGQHSSFEDLAPPPARRSTRFLPVSSDRPATHHPATNEASSERDVDFDHDVLHRGVRDAGRWAYGTILVEAWVWNDKGTHLVRPPGGWWLDPVFHVQQHEHLTASGFLDASGNAESHNGTASHLKCPLCRLTNRDLPTFEPPRPLTIGEGIAGVLWDELQHQGKLKPRTNNNSNNQNVGSRRSSIRDLAHSRGNQKRLIWRQIRDIAEDPDQPHNARLQLMAQRIVTKIGLAAAVPFDVIGSKGVVVYYARAGVNLGRLKSHENETYLVSAAQLIGSAYALRKPRQACVSRRQEELHETMARVKAKIRLLGKQRLLAKTLLPTESVEGMKPLEVEAPGPEEPLDHLEAQTVATTSKASCRDHPYVQFLEHQIVRIWSKFGGGGAQPPPAFCWSQSVWTFCGVLVTLLVITRTNVEIAAAWGDEYSIVLGPFGALMTLMFGLTGAPASQPRNAMLGQGVAVTIAILIGKLTSLEPWIRQSLATALAVTSMVKLGITHPPAGAAALLFSTGKYGWFNLLSALLGNLMAIVCSTLINDINPERQYPTFWGFAHYYYVIQNMLAPHKEDKEQEGLVKKESNKQA